MPGYVVVKVRCKKCLKKMMGENKCACSKPQPERIEMRVLTPLIPLPVQVREVVACAS